MTDEELQTYREEVDRLLKRIDTLEAQLDTTTSDEALYIERLEAKVALLEAALRPENLPATLREAGYDVREVHVDATADYVFADDTINDSFGTNGLVVVLPNEKEAS